MSRAVSRRTVTKGVAWSIPAVTLVGSIPAHAASPGMPVCTPPATSPTLSCSLKTQQSVETAWAATSYQSSGGPGFNAQMRVNLTDHMLQCGAITITGWITIPTAAKTTTYRNPIPSGELGSGSVGVWYATLPTPAVAYSGTSWNSFSCITETNPWVDNADGTSTSYMTFTAILDSDRSGWLTSDTCVQVTWTGSSGSAYLPILAGQYGAFSWGGVRYLDPPTVDQGSGPSTGGITCGGTGPVVSACTSIPAVPVPGSPAAALPGCSTPESAWTTKIFQNPNEAFTGGTVIEDSDKTGLTPVLSSYRTEPTKEYFDNVRTPMIISVVTSGGAQDHYTVSGVPTQSGITVANGGVSYSYIGGTKVPYTAHALSSQTVDYTVTVTRVASGGNTVTIHAADTLGVYAVAPTNVTPSTGAAVTAANGDIVWSLGGLAVGSTATLTFTKTTSPTATFGTNKALPVMVTATNGTNTGAALTWIVP